MEAPEAPLAGSACRWSAGGRASSWYAVGVVGPVCFVNTKRVGDAGRATRVSVFMTQYCGGFSRQRRRVTCVGRAVPSNWGVVSRSSASVVSDGPSDDVIESRGRWPFAGDGRREDSADDPNCRIRNWVVAWVLSERGGRCVGFKPSTGVEDERPVASR